MGVESCIDKVFITCVLITICAIFLYTADNNGMNETIVSDDNGDAALENLYPALVQCFAIIICGYATGRLNLITRQEAKGLNTFVSTFSLPCLIFLSLAELDLTSVNWMFLLSMLLSKLVVFIGVMIISFCISRPLHYGKPGLYAIFCTQSNDFAIGYPILMALYKNTHPEYPSYLYLMAPISLAILNPIAFVFMELGKQQDEKLKVSSPNSDVVESSLIGNAIVGNDDSINPSSDDSRERASTVFQVPSSSEETSEDSNDCSPNRAKIQLKLLGSVLSGIIRNPIVLMTILGIIGNFIYEYLHFITGILQVFGSAFSGTALFVLGLRMVGTVQKLKGDALVLPAILIAVKLLVLPLVNREITSLISPGANASDTLDLSTFGFFYGTFPTAPAVFVFSTQYNLEVDLISSGMVACTFISAPLMFISAKMISLDTSKPENHFTELESFGYDLGIVGVIVGLWLLILFIVARKFSQFPHKITAFLILSQVLICIGALLLRTVNPEKPYTMYLQFSVLAFGIYSARIWAALLAVSLLLLQTRSLCFVLKVLPYFVIIGWGIPVLAIMVVGILGASHFDQNSMINPYFVYGLTQAAVTLFILLLSFVVTSSCLIILQRHRWKQARYKSLVRDFNTRDLDSDSSGAVGCSGTSASVPRPVPAIEEIVSPKKQKAGITRDGDDVESNLCTSAHCSEEARQACSATLREYRNAIASIPEDDTDSVDPQTMRHVILLLLLTASMFVGIMLSIWTLVTADVFSGIYVELAFLDVTLNVGQVCLTFAVFGLDGWSVLSPIVSRWRKLWYGADTVFLTEIDDLSFETTHVCHQFIAHHLVECEQELAKNIRFRLVVYKSCFRGNDLVDWLVTKRLTKDKHEATVYASHLLSGRVIRHVENQHYFSDSNLLFTFRP